MNLFFIFIPLSTISTQLIPLGLGSYKELILYQLRLMRGGFENEKHK